LRFIGAEIIIMMVPDRIQFENLRRVPPRAAKYHDFLSGIRDSSAYYFMEVGL
jgi:hypothetical protein